MRTCKFCGTLLEISRNWWISCSERRDYRCIACSKTRHREYVLRNLSRKRAYDATYYQLNKSKIRGQTKSYYIRNHEAALESQRKHQRQLKERCVERFGGKCLLCGEAELSFLTFGHLSEGDGARHRRELTGDSQRRGGAFYLNLLRGNLNQYPMQLECFNCNNGKRNVSDLRKEAISAYGTKCVCCGESKINRLTLGHPENDGGKHRKLTNTDKTFYRHLRKLGFPAKPDGFRVEVQCWNCNLGAQGNRGVCPHKEENGQATKEPTLLF
jgi:hypothetical protein